MCPDAHEADSPVVFRVHAVQRMFERGISVGHVHQVLANGEVIEEYPDDYPYPSRLMLGWIATRPLHVVAAIKPDDHEVIIITVYEPDKALWEPDFRRRKL